MRWSTTPGSSCPGRVPIGSPSSAVKPRVLSTLRPSRTAHIEAPLPRWAMMARPFAASRRHLPKTLRDIFVGEPMKAIAADALAHRNAREWHSDRRSDHVPGETPYRSRRPAEASESAPAACRSARDCAAGEAARARSGVRDWRGPDRRPAPACHSRGRHGPRDGRPQSARDSAFP